MLVSTTSQTPPQQLHTQHNLKTMTKVMDPSVVTKYYYANNNNNRGVDSDEEDNQVHRSWKNGSLPKVIHHSDHKAEKQSKDQTF